MHVRAIMKILVSVIVTLVVLALISALVVFAIAKTGVINVAATADYLPGAEWFFGTLGDNSIRKHASRAVDEGRITPPREVSQAMLDNGRHHYVEMCVVCHGAPGVERGEIGKGLKPLPPEMPHIAEELTIEEIYWVVEHGIRHTGMPAYGETHSPEELWGIAAFVEELATMSPEEYARQTSAGPAEGQPSSGGDPSTEGGHDHSTHSHG